MRIAPVLFALVALAAAGCGGGGGPHSPEYRLAASDGIALDGEDDPALAPYRDALDRLGTICTDTRGELVARARTVREALHGMSIPDSALAVLVETADYAAGRSTSARRDCGADFDAALTSLELNGR